MDKASPGVKPKKAEKRKLKDSPSLKKQKEKDAAVSEVETAENIETKNDTIKSKTEKNKCTSSEIESAFNETEKTKNVKKKRSRIIMIADSSDDEDHLPVSLDFFYL